MRINKRALRAIIREAIAEQAGGQRTTGHDEMVSAINKCLQALRWADIEHSMKGMPMNPEVVAAKEALATALESLKRER